MTLSPASSETLIPGRIPSLNIRSKFIDRTSQPLPYNDGQNKIANLRARVNFSIILWRITLKIDSHC